MENPNITELGVGKIPPATWDQLIQLSNQFSNYGSGISPNAPFQSPNFKSGERGWRIDTNGNAEFNDGTFRGTFNIGGTTITIDNTEDIQDRLDEIEAAGGGTLYLQNGTYTLTEDILIPGGVTLQGVSRDGVIIDCDGTFAVKIAGTDVYSTGTVTINNGDTEVVGSGTTWTSGMVGRYINLDGLWYEITGFTDTTHLDIAEYEGDNLSGSAYVLASVNFNAKINDVTITGATGSGLVVQYSMESFIYNLVIYGCGTGIDLDYVTYPKLEVTSIENGVNLDFNFVNGFFVDFSDFSYSTTGAGIVMANSGNATFFNSSVSDNTGDGINLTSCTKIAFMSFDISGNGGQGIEFVSGCNDNQFTDGIFDGNTSDGVKLTATSDRNTLVAVSITNNGGYGINIAASTCDNNVIIAPTYSGNSSGELNDSGTGTVVVADDTAYGASWNGSKSAPTKNAIYDKVQTLAIDADVVHDTGDETIAGVKTFSSDPIIPDEAYGAGWNGSLEPPTKNAVYDKIETISTGGTDVVAIPRPVVPYSGLGARSLSNNTDGYLALFRVDRTITVNKLSFNVTAVGSNGEVNIGVFAADGQTRHISVQTASITTTGVKTVAVSSVALSPGNYYILFLSNGTSNITVSRFAPASPASDLREISSEPAICGVYTCTASTMPATLTLASISSSDDGGTFVCRLDN